MQNPEKINIHDVFASYFEDATIKKLAYAVSKKLEEGNICLDIEHEGDILTDIEDIKLSKYVTTDATDNIKPFVLYNNKIYLHRYFYYESNILEKINELVLAGKKNKEIRVKEIYLLRNFIADLFELEFEHGLKKNHLIPWQLIAALSAVLNNFSIITGGPGTGKTSTITKLLAILFKMNPDISIALAAPTGKAAARLNESLANGAKSIKTLSPDTIDKFNELKAMTVHRLLGVENESTEFNHNRDNPLNYDLIIVDESSMVDVALMSKLLDAIDSRSRLVLLGDKDQLSSIEAGSIFGDLCKSQNPINSFEESDIDLFNSFITDDRFHLPSSYISRHPNILTGSIVELQRSYRFKNTEGIGKFSNLVIRGVTDPDLLITPFLKCDDTSQCVRLTNDYMDDDFFKLLGNYEEYIKRDNISDALDSLGNVKVLCAVKEGEYGVNHYNEIIEKYLKAKGLLKPKNGFYNNQLIMITVNDYSLNLFNGDIGIVRLDKDENQLRAYFRTEEKIVSYPVSGINNYKTVFAMTIHKSQGSEFDTVIVVLPKKLEHKLISRELIYTAVTRAKNKVLIISDEDVLIAAVNQSTQRISGIVERLNQEL